jgi:hypothetical protein
MPEPITTTSVVWERPSPVAWLGGASTGLAAACRASDCHLALPRPAALAGARHLEEEEATLRIVAVARAS